MARPGAVTSCSALQIVAGAQSFRGASDLHRAGFFRHFRAEPRAVDHVAFMRALADLIDAIVCGNREIEPAAVDFVQPDLDAYGQSRRGRRDMRNIDVRADGLLA